MFRYQHSSDSEYSVTTSQRGGSNMDPVSNLYNNTMSMLNSKDLNVKYASAIALSLYVGFVAPRLSQDVSQIFNKCWFRMLFVLVVAYTSNDNPPLAIILIVAYMMSLHTANQWQIIDMVKQTDELPEVPQQKQEEGEAGQEEEDAEKYFQSLLEEESGDGLPAGSVAEPGPPESAVQEAQQQAQAQAQPEQPPKEEQNVPAPMGAGGDDFGMFASV